MSETQKTDEDSKSGFISLLPCPFCGGEAHFFGDEREDFDVGCYTDRCIMRSGSNIQYRSKDAAAREWNTRAEKSWAKGFYAGRNSVLRKNNSGCCCIIDDDDNIVSACAAHEIWKEESR
jgi:hypothetical protein